jgi:predicted methyltransferase
MSFMRLAATAMASAALLGGCAYLPFGAEKAEAPAPQVQAAAPAIEPALASVIAGPQRSAEHKSRDADRRPAEALTFWGLKPGMTVIELQPGGEAWWTEILAAHAHKTGGRYIAGHADLANPKISDGAKKARADFEAQFAAQPDVYGKIEVVGFGPVSAALGPANSADFVLTARSIHGWLRFEMAGKAFKDVFDVLKPGGMLAVEQHRAPDSQTDVKWMIDNGYVSEAKVIELATAAGFVLDAKSEINANPKDTKDHPFGVWTLPPTKRTAPFGQPDNAAFDRAKYDAIGESDRMTLRFKKPAA